MTTSNLTSEVIIAQEGIKRQDLSCCSTYKLTAKDRSPRRRFRSHQNRFFFPAAHIVAIYTLLKGKFQLNLAQIGLIMLSCQSTTSSNIIGPTISVESTDRDNMMAYSGE